VSSALWRALERLLKACRSSYDFPMDEVTLRVTSTDIRGKRSQQARRRGR
jgi:hypothetical protein